MNLALHSLAAALILSCAAVTSLRADEPKAPAASPASTPATVAAAKWNVRVEVLMVALPEQKALALLPDLRDDAKIDAAWAQLTEAIKNKEAVLTGYPVVQTLSGLEGRSETNLEKIYPTQFDTSGHPVNFEKRNVGQLLETRCHASDSGEWIQVEALIQRTELLGFDTYGPDKIEQPQFFSTKVSQDLALRNGQRTLVGVHKLAKPEGDMELFILQAQATLAR